MIESIPVHFSSEYAQVSKRPAKFDESPAQTHKNAGSVYAGIVSIVNVFKTGEYMNEKKA